MNKKIIFIFILYFINILSVFSLSPKSDVRNIYGITSDEAVFERLKQVDEIINQVQKENRLYFPMIQVAKIQFAQALHFGASEDAVKKNILQLYDIHSTTLYNPPIDLKYIKLPGEKIIMLSDIERILQIFLEINALFDPKSQKNYKIYADLSSKFKKYSFLGYVLQSELYYIMDLNASIYDRNSYYFNVLVQEFKKCAVSGDLSFEENVITRVNSYLRDFFGHDKYQVNKAVLNVCDLDGLKGFTSPIDGRIFIKRLPSDNHLFNNSLIYRSLAFHESLHLFCVGFFNQILDEGVTEYFTMKAPNIFDTTGYSNYISLASALAKTFGEDVLKNMYISGDMSPMKKEFGAELFNIILFENIPSIWPEIKDEMLKAIFDPKHDCLKLRNKIEQIKYKSEHQAWAITDFFHTIAAVFKRSS